MNLESAIHQPRIDASEGAIVIGDKRLAAPIHDALGACQDVAARRMQMAADDGKRVSDECQAMIGRITRSMSHGWPSGST